jgi:cellulose synthase/poly-beta-1,6-N-acetylglucosamine synthase-like glycosyltransferase
LSFPPITPTQQCKSASTPSVDPRLDTHWILVVDDGGNPQLAHRLESYPVTIVATGEAGSAAHARDLGTRQGESEVLVFLDADVIVAPDAIEKLVEPIQYGQAHATVGNYSRRLRRLNFAQSYKQLYVSHIYSRRHGTTSRTSSGRRLVP